SVQFAFPRGAWERGELFARDLGRVAKKIGAGEPIAIVERNWELRSCGESVVDEGRELFAKLGQLLGKWRITRAMRVEVIAGPYLSPKCAWRINRRGSDSSLRLARSASAIGLLKNDQDFKERGFRCDLRVASGGFSVWKQREIYTKVHYMSIRPQHILVGLWADHYPML